MLAPFSKAGFVTLISNLVGRTLDPTKVTLQDQVVPSTGFGTKREVQMVVTYPDAAGTGTLTKTFYYNRRQLKDLETLLLNKGTLFPEDTTVHKVLKQLERHTGILFTTFDLEDDPVVAQGSLANFTITLRAKSGSPFYKGSCTLTVGRKPLTSTLFTNSDIGYI
jgi:hypothetical protein